MLVFCLALLGCGPDRPDLSSRISPEARAEGYPVLLPLTPLLTRSEALFPSRAEVSGRSLEARAADLRRRAAALRRLQL